MGSLKVSEVKSLFNKGDARILVGCAPCQPFSSYNQKNDDPNWKLLSAFGRLIDGIDPTSCRWKTFRNWWDSRGAYVREVRFRS